MIAPISSGLLLGDQIDHLAADHAGGAGRAASEADQLTAHRRIAMRIGIRQHLERHGQQPVAGEHRGRLVELLVASRPAAPQIAVVHRRQIVVDQRIGVHHLDRRGDLQARCAAPPRTGCGRPARETAAAACRVPARSSASPRRPAPPTRRVRQQPLERGVGQPLARLGERAAERTVRSRTTASQSSFAGSAQTAPSGPMTIRSTLCCASLSFLSQCRFSCAPRS